MRKARSAAAHSRETRTCFDASCLIGAPLWQLTYFAITDIGDLAVCGIQLAAALGD